MYTHQNGVAFTDVVSSRSKSPDSKVVIMLPVDILTLVRKWPSDHEFDLRRPSRGDKPLLNKDELDLCWRPRGSGLLSMLIKCLFLVFVSQSALRYLDCSTFAVSFCCGLLYRSISTYALCSSWSREAYCCSTYQCRRVLRNRLVVSSASRVLSDCLPYTDPQHSSLFHNWCESSAGIIDICLRLRTFESRFAIFFICDKAFQKELDDTRKRFQCDFMMKVGRAW